MNKLVGARGLQRSAFALPVLVLLVAALAYVRLPRVFSKPADGLGDGDALGWNACQLHG